MGDDTPLEQLKRHQGAATCCGGCLCVSTLILTIVIVSNFHHLGPDDQILTKTPRGHKVTNGKHRGLFNPFQEHIWRKAKLLDPLQYAIVQDKLTAELKSVKGPTLLFLGAYEEVVDDEIRQKVVLEKDEYVRLMDRRTGEERVERGPGTIVPEPTETSLKGIQKAVMLNMDAAVVIRNKTNGILTLVTSCNYRPIRPYVPAPMEEIMEIRRLIHVLPHEALIVRDINGVMKVYSASTRSDADDDDDSRPCDADTPVNAGTAFFLPPYSKIVRMSWSVYAAPGGEAQPARRLQIPVADEASLYVDQLQATTHSGPKVKVAAIDLRTHKSFYKYEVRTSDNVQLDLEGTIFWKVEDVQQMIKMTSDPAGDVWAHARSTLIGVVSNTTLGNFMYNFHSLVDEAFELSTTDDFYSIRGIRLTNMELTRYAPVDPHTQSVLQNIIRQTVNRINDLQKQRSQNEVAMEKMEMDVQLEENRTLLINTQAENSRLLAETAGATDGTKVSHEIRSFVDGLNETMPNQTGRLELFRQQKIYESTNRDTKQLATGEASLYVAPKDLDLRLQIPHAA